MGNVMKNKKLISEIEKVMGEWSDAVEAKDLDRLKSYCSEDFQCFDIMQNVKNTNEYIALWSQCLDYFDRVKIERKDVVIQCGDSLAYVFFLSRISGFKEVPAGGDMARSWMRISICLRKENDDWKMVHEHSSFPVNCETGAISYILDD